jgi:hypothetical protein
LQYTKGSLFIKVPPFGLQNCWKFMGYNVMYK